MNSNVYREKIIKILLKKDAFVEECISNNYERNSETDNNVEYVVSIKNNMRKYVEAIREYLEEKKLCYEVEMCSYYIKKIISKENEFAYINNYIFLLDDNINISIDFQTGLNDIYIIENIINMIEYKIYNSERIKQSKNYNFEEILNDNTVVFSGEATGTIIHETIGHTLEDKCNIRSWKEGDRLFNIDVDVIDDPTMNNFVGSYPLDDEGNKPIKKYLIKDGRINDFLCSGKNNLGKEYGGNARCEDYLHKTRARMSNTYLDNQENKDILANLDEYIYIHEIISGGVNYDFEQVHLLANAIFVNKNNELYSIGKVFISEDISDFLKKLEKIGSNIVFASSCWCFKESDIPIPVKYGGPVTLFKNLKVMLVKE